MNYLSVENITKTYGQLNLFEDLSFGIQKGEKVALVANNGSGKSTILKILAGKEHAESGEYNFREDIRIGFLGQDPRFNPDLSINELISESNSFMADIKRNYQEALDAQAKEANDNNLKEVDRLTGLMDRYEVWDYERRVKEILHRFEITELDQKSGTLSGGQKKRLSLALALLDHPDMLILDEPTNHLDIDMIEWLEKYLSASNITLLMVTHDRYFLDRVCNRILELYEGKMYSHSGSYQYFLEKKAERIENSKVEYDKNRKLWKNELEWVRRMPKARTTKSKSRIESFEELEEKIRYKPRDLDLEMQVRMSRLGGKIIEFKNVGKSFGDKTILSKFNYNFNRKERIGIVGDNGTGKSTFLKLVSGSLDADAGKIIRGETIVLGHYKQEGLQIKEDKKVIKVLTDIAEYIQMADGSTISASQLLQHFLFSPQKQHTFVSKLSGGEKRRLYLLTILIKNPNFLILDEPTNDLDLITLTRLEDFLMHFDGCLIVVSHDRYFMDKVIDHLFIFKGDGIVEDFPGTYSEYRKEVQQKENELKKSKQEAEGNSTPKVEKPKSKLKVSYKDKLRFETISKTIEELEENKATLEEKLNSENDFEKLQSYSEEIGKILDELESLEMEWLELDDLINTK